MASYSEDEVEGKVLQLLVPLNEVLGDLAADSWIVTLHPAGHLYEGAQHHERRRCRASARGGARRVSRSALPSSNPDVYGVAVLWNDPDFLAATLELLRLRGSRAPATAEARAEQERENGNRAGFAAWMRLKEAAEELLRERESTDSTH
jgi:hypothetical protein